MADIVERLRSNAAGTTYLKDNDSDSDVMLEAAAEIVALNGALTRMSEQLQEQAAEIARLRAAERAAFRRGVERADDAADAARYRYLRDQCGFHMPMTHTQPAEWSITWEFQQGTPDEAYGTFDTIIDKEIAAHARFEAAIQAEEDEEDAKAALASALEDGA